MSTDLKTVKIALLICGSLTGKAYALNGDYYDIYSKFIRDSTPEGTTFSLDPYDVVHKMDYPSEDDYDCIMLTGSGVCLILSLKTHVNYFRLGRIAKIAASAYENIEWVNKLVGYIARVAETKPHVKLIGAPRTMTAAAF